VQAIYTGSEFVDTINTGDDIGLVLESTSFYAEQGGQVSSLLNKLYVIFHYSFICFKKGIIIIYLSKYEITFGQ